MKNTIYLCGPIQNRTDDQCVAWREQAKIMWGLRGKTLDPLRRDYRGRELDNPEQLVTDDLNDIDEADGLLVYFDGPSVGTSMEIFYAKHVLKKPVVVVNVSSMPVLPVWLVYHADAIRNDVQSGLVTLHHLLLRHA